MTFKATNRHKRYDIHLAFLAASPASEAASIAPITILMLEVDLASPKTYKKMLAIDSVSQKIYEKTYHMPK